MPEQVDPTHAPVALSPETCLNPNLRGAGQSATVAINARCVELRRQGKTVYKLGLGQSPFPVPQAVVEELRVNAGKKEYLPVPGLDGLREAVADYHRRTCGVPMGMEQIIVGPGSKELMFLLQVVFQGELLVVSPAWVSYAPQAKILGREVRYLETHARDGWRLDPASLDTLCIAEGPRPRVMVLNYPSNPTGTTYTRDELAQIAAIARRHHVVLLSDEIYGELHFEGQHRSVAPLYPEGTIVSSGLSKWCGAGGWRLGTFAFPATLGWLRDAVVTAASETYTSTSAPIQYASVRAFQGGVRIERYLWLARKILAALAREIVARLRAAEIEVATPAGAFYLFPDFSAHADALRARGVSGSRQLCERLLIETGVAILPGVDFGRPETELTARIAFVDFDGARAMAAAETSARDAAIDVEFVTEYAGEMLTGIDRLCSWVGARS